MEQYRIAGALADTSPEVLQATWDYFTEDLESINLLALELIENDSLPYLND